MAIPGIRKIALMWVAVAFTSASLLLSADPAIADPALFRVKRTWWFGGFGLYTNGHVTPPAGTRPHPYEPPAIAGVGATASHPAFTAPKSFIKNTTYTLMYPPGGCPCEPGVPRSSSWYSHWNAKGSFRPNNPYGATTTTTVRVRTTADGYAPSLMGWSTAMRNVLTEMGKVTRTVTVATPSPTAMGNLLTPTTTWSGRYDHSRGGSIMIWPGTNRFGGTLRFFVGPNERFYKLITTYDWRYSTTLTVRPKALSQQLGTGIEFAIGEVTESYLGFDYRLTRPFRQRLVIGTTSMGGPEYYVRVAHYLITRAPYTTGMVQVWEPNGNTNTIQTATGYDNRTPAGLNGNISLVHPRLVHAYTVFPPSSGKPIKLTWSSARMRKIDFRFLPEPAGAAMLVAGCAALLGLYRLRRR